LTPGRRQREAALIMLNVDHFKRINDTHGHGAGDMVLRSLVELCHGTCRDTDTVGRIGGEEFAILCTDTDEESAIGIAERLRARIETTTIRVGSANLQVTASFGVAVLAPGITSAEAWFERADVALYEAKRSGRNRCRLFRTRVPASAA
jgi:diguanylate cyclase (GGDEF)-like protein